MTTIKNAPKQPFIETKDPFSWDDEQTLVDRQNRLGNRILRFLTNFWLWLTIGGILLVALLDAEVMRFLMSILGIIVMLGTAALYLIFQIFIMYWVVARTRQYTIMPGAEGVGFADYVGQPEILEQAKQIVTLLRGVKAFEEAGGEPLNGLLLEGPPGTGKTWLAQAISTEAGVPFYYIDTSSLQGMFMGVGSMKVGRVFSKARKAAKEYGAAVIFLDEIDAIGSRGAVASVNSGQGGMGGMMGGMMGGSMGLLSTMLIEMSGFTQVYGWRARLKRRLYHTFLRREPAKPAKRVLTIGATNRIAALDPALLRPGRFDKKIRIDAPDAQGRRDIFEYYLSKMAHDETMKSEILATETFGYTPADIKYLLNEALRYALFEGRRYMTYADFQRAVPEHEIGLRAPLNHMSQEARERLACYIASKACAVRLFLPENRIARVSVVMHGMLFGHVLHYPARETYQGMRTLNSYRNVLRVNIAGKAGEMEFCGTDQQTMMVNLSSNPNQLLGGDFHLVRQILSSMALAGMLGPLGATAGKGFATPESGSLPLSKSPEMRQAMEEMYQTELAETRRILREHKPMVLTLQTLLLEKQEMLADEIEAFFDQYGLLTPKPEFFEEQSAVSSLPEEALTGDGAEAGSA